MSEEHSLTSLSSFVDIPEEVPVKLLKAKTKKAPKKIGLGDAKQTAKEEKQYQRYKERHAGVVRSRVSILKMLMISPDGYWLGMIPHILKTNMDAVKKTYKYCVGIESQIDSHDYLKDKKWVPFIISKLDPNDSRDPFLVKAVQEHIIENRYDRQITPITLTGDLS